MRRIGGMLLGLLAAGPLSSPARAGDPPDGLDAWIAAAEARGEPTTTEDLQRPPTWAPDTGVARLVAAMRTVEHRVAPFRGKPESKWTESAVAASRVLVRRERAYFEALHDAGEARVFRPRQAGHSHVPDDTQALTLAWDALGCRAALGSEEAADAILWLLRTQPRWVGRTWADGLRWDEGVRRALGIVLRMAERPSFGIPLADAWTMDVGFATLERMLLASVRPRLYTKRLNVLESAAAFRSGRDPFQEGAEALAKLREILGDGPPGEPFTWPEMPTLGVDVPDYRVDHEALARDSLASLEDYDVALAAAGNVPRMRLATEAPPDSQAGRAAAADMGQFAYLLDLVARLRLARIAVALIRDRASGLPGIDALRALLARDELWDPVSGLPFEVRRTSRHVHVVRPEVPPRTTAPDAPARLTVTYDAR